MTNPLRTLVDLGAVLRAPAVEDARDRVLVARLTTVAGVEAALDGLAGRGRRGAGVLRAVLDGRALGRRPARRAARAPHGPLAPRRGAPAAVFQHEVRD